MFSPTGLVRPRASLGAPASLPIAIGVAILAGWLMDLGFPDRDWWPLTLLGTAAMMFAVRGLSLPKALLVGAVGGFTFYGITIWWLTVYLGLVPWIALTLAEVVIFSLGMGLIALIWRYGSAHWSSVAGRLGVLPALVGGAWMLREAISSMYPWGGFAWLVLLKASLRAPLRP
jgi:apolipoprotein N-acyltransferase